MHARTTTTVRQGLTETLLDLAGVHLGSNQRRAEIAQLALEPIAVLRILAVRLQKARSLSGIRTAGWVPLVFEASINGTFFPADRGDAGAPFDHAMDAA